MKQKLARERFKDEAVAAWVAFQKTGRHLTGEEVRAWLKSWGSAAERELPDCHE